MYTSTTRRLRRFADYLHAPYISAVPVICESLRTVYILQHLRAIRFYRFYHGYKARGRSQAVIPLHVTNGRYRTF